VKKLALVALTLCALLPGAARGQDKAADAAAQQNARGAALLKEGKFEEAAIEQSAQLPGGLWRQAPCIECLQRFLQRKLGFSQHLCGPILLTLFAFPSHQFMQVAFIAELFPFRLPRHLFVALPDRRQVGGPSWPCTTPKGAGKPSETTS